MERVDREEKLVKSVHKALKVLRSFSTHSPEMDLTEVARINDLPKSTTHRLLKTLEQEGFIFHETGSKKYKLGIHQKRLNKLIDCLDRELRGLGDSKFKVRDQYVARIFDLLDLLKKASRTIV